MALSGDAEADTAALAQAISGEQPCLVLDFLWGPVAETAFHALALAGAAGRPGAGANSGSGSGEDGRTIKYVQIGALAGLDAAVPSALLRSTNITVSGSGAGSVSSAEIRAKIPDYIKLIADGSVDVPFRTFPLTQAGAAWTASAAPGPRVVLVPA